MFRWIYMNIGTIIIALMLVLFVVMIVKKMINDKKAGKSSCGCNCGSCPMGGSCHQK